VKYAFIHEQRDTYRINRMCSVLGVSRCGYYAWRNRPPSRREQENVVLLDKIKAIHEQYRGVCGSDKTWRLLNEQGNCCGRHRVAKLRRKNGIEAVRMKRFRGGYAARNSEPAADNILNRDFSTNKPNAVWVADTTFIPTRQGAIYLAIVLDLYARQVVGWGMSASNNRQLVCSALNMAVPYRNQPPVEKGDGGI
jgi:transposase InsO family protein